MNFPVFDLHCDTALALLGEDRNSAGSLKKNQGHIDLVRAKSLPGYAQCFACYTTPQMYEWYGISPVVIFERELATIQREVSQNCRQISLAYTAADIRQNLQKGKASAILTLEGTAGIGYDPEILQDLSLIGFRMVTLTWNEQNPLAGSHLTGGGLTDRGREFVREAQRVGMCVDVSHLSDEAFWDIMDITDAPIVASHSNSRSFRNVSRNLTDDMFRAICAGGGVAGFNLYADFVGEDPSLDTACDHLMHMAQMDPDCRHIALGGDLDGCDRLVEGFTGVDCYNLLAEKMRLRGFTDENIMNIFWNNAMGVISGCCM